MATDYSTYTVIIKNTEYLLHLCYDIIGGEFTEFWLFSPVENTWMMLPITEFNEALLPYGLELAEIPV